MTTYTREEMRKACADNYAMGRMKERAVVLNHYQAMKEKGIKQGGTWWHDPTSASRLSSSKSPQRKFASTMIAKIPLPLSRHIAAVYAP